MLKKIFIVFSLAFSLIFTSCGTANSVSKNKDNSTQQKEISKNIEETKPNTIDNNLNIENTNIEDLQLDNKNKDKTSGETKKDTKDEAKNETKQEETSTETISSQSSFDTTEQNWYYIIKKDGSPSGKPNECKDWLEKYSGYFLGDTSKKTIYLTFDEGYENGYTSKILDVLKNNKVKAAFFVTTPYIKDNKELVKRMVDEGHTVCNHSTKHPSMAKTALQGEESFKKEFEGCEKAFKDLTGKDMPKFFRPPMGKYSELSLAYTKNLGYKTIFWSFAYHDWDPKEQPSHEKALNTLKERTHPGGIYLLHAVSKTNTEILDEQIKKWAADGFEFKTLEELP